jgi:hypothetical protein
MDDEKLIEAVRDHPCLYNAIHPHYRVLLKKENAWKAISEAMGPNISGKINILVYIGSCICYSLKSDTVS